MLKEIRHKRIAIIGSGSSILKLNKGSYIDKFDFVFRFNRAITEGLEEQVGYKTTHRVLNPLVYKCDPIGERFTNQDRYLIRKVKNINIITFALSEIDIKRYKSNIHESNSLSHVNELEVKNFNNIHNLNKPTLGFFFIKYLLSLGLEVDIEIFGFDVNVMENKASHYWEDRDKTVNCHNYVPERIELLNLEKQGKIKIHI
jgi:hypothetical protein